MEQSILGPHTVSAVDDYVRGRIVAQGKVPVILKDGQRYAILAPPGKDLRVVCAGCFVPGMSLFDDSKCKKVSLFSQHWDLKKGERKECCKAIGANTLEACIHRLDEQGIAMIENIDSLLEDAARNNNKNQPVVADLSSLSSEALVQELASRDALMEAVVQVNTDDLAVVVKERGVKLLYDARFEDLEREMRRVADPCRPTMESFYWKEKTEGMGHVSDEPVATFEDFGKMVTTRSPSKRKARRESYETRSKDGAKRYKLRVTDARTTKTSTL
jgi:hypothetical protein